MAEAMKVIVAGSRLGVPYEELERAIAAAGWDITELVHGGTTGVDSQADRWAREHDIPITVFRAAWGQIGRAAGPVRNRKMAQYADALIALCGGDGTRNMIREAHRAGIPVFVDFGESAASAPLFSVGDPDSG